MGDMQAERQACTEDCFSISWCSWGTCGEKCEIGVAGFLNSRQPDTFFPPRKGPVEWFRERDGVLPALQQFHSLVCRKNLHI